MNRDLSLRAFNRLFPDEASARQWFEQARWPHGATCPSCSSVAQSRWLKVASRWECRRCGRQFTVTAGTPMHRTHLPLPAYRQFAKRQMHLAVNHSAREYARTDQASGLRVHVNRVESCNSFLGRAVTGVFHFVSPKHLGRYALEAAFRWNRKLDRCLARMAGLIRKGEGRTLPYRVLTAPA